MAEYRQPDFGHFGGEKYTTNLNFEKTSSEPFFLRFLKKTFWKFQCNQVINIVTMDDFIRNARRQKCWLFPGWFNGIFYFDTFFFSRFLPVDNTFTESRAKTLFYNWSAQLSISIPIFFKMFTKKKLRDVHYCLLLL